MCCSQQKFREPNLFGHVYDGQKSEEGYAICSACDCRENSKMAAKPCHGTMLGLKLSELQEKVNKLECRCIANEYYPQQPVSYPI